MPGIRGGWRPTPAMDISINKSSEVPLRQQLAEQIVILIGTEKLKPGALLPSIRDLARRLKIHHNTVSEAYQELERRDWIALRQGKRATVLPREERPQDLDDLINTVIRLAQDRGYGLQEVARRVRERLESQPPDHLLVVVEEQALGELLAEEIREALACPVKVCLLDELKGNAGLLLGAQVVTPLIYQERVAALAPKACPVQPLAYTAADPYVDRVRELGEPSVIAVVSVSRQFLRTALPVFASAADGRHSFCEFLLPLESPDALRAADIVFCDTIARRQIKAPTLVHCRLLSTACLDSLAATMTSPTSSHKEPL